MSSTILALTDWIADAREAAPRLARGLIPLVRQHPRYQGCVGHWLCGEAGGVLYDMSGAENHGVMTGGATWGTGSRGPVLELDGADDYINIPSTFPYIQSAKPFTLSTWTKLDAFTTTYPSILTLRTNTTDAFQYFFSSDPSYDDFCFGSATSWTNLLMAVTPTVLGTWWHVVVTYTGAGAGTAGNFAGYLNGIPQTLSASGGFSSLSQANQIGTDLTGSTWWDGQIDDVRIYHRVLAPTEIVSLYQAPFLEYAWAMQHLRRRQRVGAAAAPPGGPDIGSLSLLGAGV